MTQSMTGFGSAEINGYRVEIRSLNSRFLDMYIKVPSFLNQFDIPLRNLLKERFARGKFDATVSVSENVAADFRVNTAIAARLCAALRKLQNELSLAGEVDITMVAGFHSLFLETDTIYDADILYKVFNQAMDALSDMRTSEGGCLAAELLKLTDTLAVMNGQIKDLTGDAVREMTGKFNEKIKALLSDKDIDSSRVLQEAALMAIKLDIAEEVARIDSHIKQFKEILSGDDVVGRKLDFIVQELNREVNTISSKSGEYAITSVTVDMKSMIEKIKEQVQNIQ